MSIRCLAGAVALSLITPSAAQEAVHDDWSLEVAVDLGRETKLGGCAVGDFDPAHPGAEIGVVASDGRVLVVRSTDDGFVHEQVARLSGEQIQCAIGDLRPELPGDELVTVGMLEGEESDEGEGAYHVFARVDGKWREVESGRRPALIHAVAVGAFSDASGGDVLVLGGFYGHGDVGVMTDEGRVFRSTDQLALPANAKAAAVGLGGFVFACDDGSLHRFEPTAAGFGREDYGSWDGALARIAVDAHGVLVCGNDGELRYRQSRLNGGYGSTARVAQSDDRLRGAVIADVDPNPGAEFATAGYDGNIYVAKVYDVDPDDAGLRLPAKIDVRVIGSSDFVVARAADKVHHLAAGSLPHRGGALVAVGYSGRVLVVRHVGGGDK